MANNNSRESIPWIEKYRPKTMDQIMSHQDIIMTLDKLMDKLAVPHLLFFGPPGTGKTSTIRCCAQKLYGEYINYMMLELNASNDRGIDTVRTKIKPFVNSKTRAHLPDHMKNVFKLVVLDESDSMTSEAQGMLRQIIEKNSATTRFCLICNDIDKLNIALRSRCSLFCFAPLRESDMLGRLAEICKMEKVKCPRQALKTIIKITKGDMRAAINTLNHVSTTITGKITIEDIYQISGFCLPSVIDGIFNRLCSLEKGKMTMHDCVDEIHEIVIENNITVFNLLSEFGPRVMEGKFTRSQKIFLTDNLANVEIYDAVNIDVRAIIMIIASSFVILRNVS